MTPENPQKSPKKEQFHCFLNPAQSPSLPDGAPDKAVNLSLDIMLYRLTDIEDRLVVVKGEGGGGGMEGEAGISRCKLFYIGWANNKVLL